MADILMTRNARCDIGTDLIIFLKMISDYDFLYFFVWWYIQKFIVMIYIKFRYYVIL